MKKFFALILALVCVFAVAFTACEVVSVVNEGTNNEQTGDNNEDKTPDGGNEEDDTHTHNYETTWSYDSLTHWHKATCHPDVIKEQTPHEYVNSRCKSCNREELYRVGDILPDFTVETYNSSYKEGSFSSASARGKVLILNFWYTNCGPCIQEMPELEEINNQFGDDVAVVALHKCDSDQAGAQSFINKSSWNNYETIFGKDLPGDKLFKICGGTTFYPITVVLDGEGVIVRILNGNIIDFDVETKEYTNLLTPVIEALLAR